MTEQLPPAIVIPRALGTIEAVWAETLDPPRAPAGNSGGGGGKPASRAPMPDGAFEARRAAAEVLSSWCVLIGDERGVCPVKLGGEAVLAMAAWLRGHVDWLAEHELGDQAAVELDDVARDLERLAYPDRRDDLFIGRCPVEFVPGGPPCNRRLYWPKGALTLKCVGCGVEDDVEGWLARMGDELPDQLTAVQLSTFLTRQLRREISHDLVRKWASRGFLASVGKDERGRPLYSAIDCIGPANEQVERSQRPPRRVVA